MQLRLAIIALLAGSLSAHALPAGMSDQDVFGGLTITYTETPSVVSGQTNVFVQVNNTSGVNGTYNLYLGDRITVTAGIEYELQLLMSRVSSSPSLSVGFHLYTSPPDTYSGEHEHNALTVQHGSSNMGLPVPDISVTRLTHRMTVPPGIQKIQPRITVYAIPPGQGISFNVISTNTTLITGGTVAAGCGVFGPIATSAPGGAIAINTSSNVSSVVGAAAAGATFYFAAGTYRGVNVTNAKDNQTFIGAQGAILNGSKLLTGWTFDGTNYWVGGQTQEGYRHPGSSGRPGSVRHNYPEAVYINNVPLYATDSTGSLAVGKFYFDYAADRIYIRDNPTGQTVETTSGPEGAFLGGGNGVTVKNFVVEKYASPIQAGQIDSKGKLGWTVQNNEVRLGHSVGIKLDGGGAGANVSGNYVHDNGQMGLGGNNTPMLIDGNRIGWNGYWSQIDPYWEGGGSKWAITDGLIVRNNFSHDNYGWGLWTDIDNINALYENNVLMRNTGGGISHEISYASTIRNNVFIKNGTLTQGWMFGGSINIQNSKNVQVYGNKVDVTGAVTPGGSSCQNGNPPCTGNTLGMIQQNRGTGAYGLYATTGNNVHDNIFMTKDAQGVNGYHGGAADYNPSGMFSGGGNLWSNNTYYMPDGSNRFWWNGSQTNFASFKTATGENGTISQTYPDSATWTTCQ